jgi:hypothetical protein
MDAVTAGRNRPQYLQLNKTHFFYATKIQTHLTPEEFAVQRLACQGRGFFFSTASAAIEEGCPARRAYGEISSNRVPASCEFGHFVVLTTAVTTKIR